MNAEAVLITELKDAPSVRHKYEMDEAQDPSGERRAVARGAQMPTQAIAETILREAPFASRGRAWRGLLESQAFEGLSVEGLRWFQRHVLEPRDRGEDVAGLDDSLAGDASSGSDDANVQDEHFSAMAAKYVELFVSVPAEHKDIYVDHLYEAMAASILLVISTSSHSTRRRDAASSCEDLVLKRHVINMCAEWTLGMRPRHVGEDHWIVRATTRGTPQPRPAASTASKATLDVGSLAVVDEKPTAPRDTRVHATYTLQHSPFFSHHLERLGVKPSPGLAVKLGLTVGSSRCGTLVRNHVPRGEREAARRRIQRALRVASKPLPVSYVLSNSGVARRAAMEDQAKQRSDAAKAAAHFARKRRDIARQVEADQQRVLESDNLREYATNLATERMRNKYQQQQHGSSSPEC